MSNLEIIGVALLEHAESGSIEEWNLPGIVGVEAFGQTPIPIYGAQAKILSNGCGFFTGKVMGHLSDSNISSSAIGEAFNQARVGDMI